MGVLSGSATIDRLLPARPIRRASHFSTVGGLQQPLHSRKKIIFELILIDKNNQP